MSARLRAIARETEAIVEAGFYRTPQGREVSIERALTAALSGTRLYGPEPVPVASLDHDRTPVVEVTDESSLQAAARMTGERPGKVAVLNYASARNPGGGYLNGAQAQEEALCRGSALYATLRRAPEFYAHHRAERSPFYTDRVIHSPGVPVFRDDRGRLLDTPYLAGFLTSPAPNAGVIRRTDPGSAHLVGAALAARAERVLEVAAVRGYRRLVLGAWGCGVFRCDPLEVAGVFRALLADEGRFAGHFEQLVFGILDRDGESPTRAAFDQVFETKGQPSP
ncbi:TIGR02452 family protein [Streptomyces sp. NPDC088115]|uniref:TIGR02452 family protein n=1 Tax=Streptomyces sp. NPDC088115 TaxID=3365824 RepID=UPI003825EB8F